jgi:hypothetical protein
VLFILFKCIETWEITAEGIWVEFSWPLILNFDYAMRFGRYLTDEKKVQNFHSLVEANVIVSSRRATLFSLVSHQSLRAKKL